MSLADPQQPAGDFAKGASGVDANQYRLSGGLGFDEGLFLSPPVTLDQTGSAPKIAVQFKSLKRTQDVTMTTAGTFYDGPSITLGVGTWLVIGTACCLRAGGTGGFTVQLTASSLVDPIAFAESQSSTTDTTVTVTIAGLAVLAASATVTLSARCTAASATLLAAVPDGNPVSLTYNGATRIMALQLG